MSRLPEWARAAAEDSDNADGPSSGAFISKDNETVLLKKGDTTPPFTKKDDETPPSSDETSADEETVQVAAPPRWLLLTRKYVDVEDFDRQGTVANIGLATYDGGIVALVVEGDGSTLVSEDGGACGATFSCTTSDLKDRCLVEGSVTEYAVDPDTEYAWALVAADGGSFWLPASVCVGAKDDEQEDERDSGADPARSSSEAAMQDSGRGSLYLEMPGGAPPIHHKTAFSICQPGVGKPDPNRKRRFHKLDATNHGQDDLEEGKFYAVELPSRGAGNGADAAMCSTTFFVGELTTLNRVQACKTAAHVGRAQLGSPGLRVTFVLYERATNGTYSRTADQLIVDLDDEDHLRIICQVDVSWDDQSNSVLVLADGTGQLLARRSFVHELALNERLSVVLHVPSVKVVVSKSQLPQGLIKKLEPTRRRKKRQGPLPPAPLPFTINDNRRIGHVRHQRLIFQSGQVIDRAAVSARISDESEEAQCPLKSGDVIFAVNNEPVETSAEARATLRAALRDVGADGGGNIPVVVWRPPTGFVEPDATEAATGGAAALTTHVTKRTLPSWTDQEMRNLRRITTCLYGGARERRNLTAICKALQIPTTGSIAVLKILIEQDLRRREFRSDTSWDPTDAILDSPDEVEKVKAHYLRPLLAHLRKLSSKGN